MFETRHACSGDWELLKAIRLEALRDSPDAFCTAFDEALDYVAQWNSSFLFSTMAMRYG